MRAYLYRVRISANDGIMLIRGTPQFYGGGGAEEVRRRGLRAQTPVLERI